MRLRRSRHRKRQRPPKGGRYPLVQATDNGSAVVAASGNARNIRAIEANIGQFAVAELGQLSHIALIIPECLDHADEREQHGSLLAIRFSSWSSLIVEM